MNGTCAGGTGAFIDQMATLLGHVRRPRLDRAQPRQASSIYPIASRCGVFAKSDIQPLLNQGARKEDIAASIFQAVVNQTITGLAQGRRIAGKVLFLGGPLYFCQGPAAARFVETLKLSDGERRVSRDTAAVPWRVGAAHVSPTNARRWPLTRRCLSAIEQRHGQKSSAATRCAPLFEDRRTNTTRFSARHERACRAARGCLTAIEADAYLGIDCGSTTTKLVARFPPTTELLYTYYASNNGNPVDARAPSS